ncbi:MAG: TonB-dependent receptor, partial [Bacteroidota bacterium]
MKLSLLFLMTISFALQANPGYAQNKKISLKMTNVTVAQVMDEIESKTEFKFIFNTKTVNLARKISINVKKKSIQNVLSQLFNRTEISYEVYDQKILLKKDEDKVIKNPIVPILEEVQGSSVSGLVLDNEGVPLPGANIIEKGTLNGTQTDFDGNFSLNVADDNAVLVISYIGFVTKEVLVNGQTDFTIVLEQDTAGLDEVVVVGYGTSKKKDLTGAVASVNIEDTRLQPNANAAQILRGTTAGVQVVDNGIPGSAGSIRIRGQNSISGSNDPLIVLDGVIYAGGSLADINPGDIESISILKDASSTAIYGSLAANGVIEITTKKGKLGAPKITFNTYTGVSNFSFLPDYMNAEQYLQARRDAEAVQGSTPFQPVEITNIEAYENGEFEPLDPFEAVEQYAPISNYELAIAGKTEKIDYYLSGSYQDVTSPLLGSDFSRLGGRLNLGIQVTDWLKLGINSGYSSRDNGGATADLFSAAYVGPFASLYLEDGITPKLQPMDISLTGNPILNPFLNDQKNISNILFANVYTNIDLYKGLSYRLNVGYFREDNKFFQFTDAFEQSNSLASGSKQHSEEQNVTLENIVTYKKLFAEKHAFDLTLLYGIYEFEQQLSELSSNNIFDNTLGFNSLEIGENFNINTDARENKQVSSMARLGYNYDGRYFLNLSIRRDGYSAFGAGNKYGTFRAAGVSWNISEEEFLSKVDFLNFLKLRLTWGENGNRGVSEYASLSEVVINNYVFGEGGSTAVGLQVDSFANPDLGWETTESLNVGFDVQMFSNRLSASVNYYTSDTQDLLLRRAIPNMNGFSSFLTNIGEVNNKGLEVDLSATILKNDNFSWDSNIAFSFNRNKITSLTGADNDGDGIEDDNIANSWFIGEPLGTNFDYVFDGIYQEGDDFSLIEGAEPGDIRFRDISGPDGVPDGVITPDDRTVVGNDQRDYLMGLTNIFSYKGFSLSSTFNIVQGGESPNNTRNPGTNFFDQANILNTPYWTPENQINTAARINYKNPFEYGFYEDRSFVRLQDVSLSYTFSSQVLDQIGISALQLYASGKNLITWTDWTGWDPEFGGGLRNINSGGRTFQPLLR